MPLKLKVKKLADDAIMPKFEHEDDAGLDLFASKKVTLAPGERAQVPTGVAMEIPQGYVGLIWDKSGLSQKVGLKTLGGVIDAGYRGEVMVGMVNLGEKPYTIEKHHKVAQMVIQERKVVEIEEAVELAASRRGEKGFGSSGK